MPPGSVSNTASRTSVSDVLLAIFDHYTNDAAQIAAEKEGAWQLLVHVCRRLRSIFFGSPRHLNLWLVCMNRIRAFDMLDVWPASHFIILCYSAHRIGSVDNITAVLGHRDRVCQIDFADILCSSTVCPIFR
jgi:hypothetical protein